MFKSFDFLFWNVKSLDDFCQGIIDMDKCMKKSSVPNLPHIKGFHITKIASQANVDWSYVWMILNGKREANSRRAKAIVSAATKMNTAIDKALQVTAKELTLIGEND